MNWLDFLIIAVGALVALAGWRMGGIHIAVTAIGIMFGLTLASRLHDNVQPIFSGFKLSDNASEVGGFIAIFLLVLVVSLVISFSVRAIPKPFMLGWLDNTLGVALGIALTFAVGSAALSTIQSYPVLGLETTIADSTAGTFLADKFDVVMRGAGFIPDDLGT